MVIFLALLKAMPLVCGASLDDVSEPLLHMSRSCNITALNLKENMTVSVNGP